MERKIPGRVIYLLGIILITILGIYITSITTRFMDIQLSDETQYLLGGINFLHKIPSSWGPAYSAWYKLLHFVEHDPIALYYLNYRTLSVILSLLIFSLLFRLKVNVLLAFFAAVSFLFCDLNIFSWPMISHFAASIILATFLISTFLKSTYKKLLLFTMSALIIYYARPEMGLSFAILLVSTGVYVIWKKFRLPRSEYIITIAMLPIVAFLFLKVDVPLVSGGPQNGDGGQYPRSVLAYGQHFFLNYSERNNVEEMVMPGWFDLYEEYYDVQPSLVKTLLSNIPATIKHVAVNIRHYISTAFDYISGIFLPDKIFYFPLWLKFLLFLGALIALVFIKGQRAYLTDIEKYYKENALSIYLVFILTIPPMIACVLIYPREHYIMLQVPMLLIFLTLILLAHFSKIKDSRFILAGLFGLAALLFFIFPHADKYEHFSTWQKRSGLVNLGAIEKINEMAIDQPFNILLAEGRMDTYLNNPNIKTLVGYNKLKGLPFDRALDSLNIGMVYVTSVLEVDPEYNADDLWVKFNNDPTILNFERVDLNTPYSYLLVNKELLGH